MMADRIAVDLAALRLAADGIADALNAMATRRVADIDAPRAAFGHDGLADTVADFCDRWQIGVGHLTSDAAQVADRLDRCALAYEHADRLARGRFAGRLEIRGPDPGAT
jgi:hypothetical protein